MNPDSRTEGRKKKNDSWVACSWLAVTEEMIGIAGGLKPSDCCLVPERREELLINGGGHPMAAGLTVAEDRLAALRDFLDRRLARRIAEAP